MTKKYYNHGDIIKLDIGSQLILIVENYNGYKYGVFDLKDLRRLNDPLINIKYNEQLTHEILIDYISKTKFAFINYEGTLSDFQKLKIEYPKSNFKSFNLRNM